jgi:chlorophyll synthase
MSEIIRQLAVISRAEFLLPNLGSLIMGLAWGASPPLSFAEMIILVVLSFAIINLSSAIGAQANTISDYELDSRDNRKKELVQALDSFGHTRLKQVLILEFVVTLGLVVLFMLAKAKPVLLLLWLIGISLGCLYSAPPLRIKSRSWLAPVTLILVLAVFPILFAYLTFTSELNPLFLLALAGLASTVYGVIIPTETRDYFGDEAMGIETMTVHLGLVKASLLSIVLLSLGGTLIATAFFIAFSYGHYPILSLSVFAIAVADLIVLRKLRKLYLLSKEYENSSDQNSVAREITSFSANNPKWIMMVTQTYSLVSIILLVSKFLH